MSLRLSLIMLASLLACQPEPPEACAPPVDASDRPLAHFTPPEGWMNDPAGLVHHDGLWHLFYQRDPHAIFVSDVRWGHATSPDLLRWTDAPDALERHPVLGVPFTGSAVIDPGAGPGASGLCDRPCLLAVFTHALGADGRQKQSVATSTDGREFTLYEGNPVLESPGPADFRDPKVRRHAPTSSWVMVIGVPDGVMFYRSPNLREWTYAAAFSPGDPALAGAFECPDLFPLTAPDGAERWVLKADVNPGALLAGPSRVWIGDFDGFTFTPEQPGTPFDGPDLYAAQTFSHAPDGHTVWLGWMSAWSYALFTPTEGYRGAMSTPRELSLIQAHSGLRLQQRPIDTPGCALADEAVRRVDGEVTLLDDPGPAWRLDARLVPGAASEAGLIVLQGDEQATRVGYRDGAIFLDRTRSGDVSFHDDFPGVWTAEAALDALGGLDLTVIVDRTSVEIFGGGAALTAAVYPTSDGRALSAFAVGGAATLAQLRVTALDRGVPR